MSIELGTIGKCIYCGTTAEPLQDEHIVPYGLNGPWILREASCPKCAAITSAFEGSVLRGFLKEVRSALGFKTRRKKLQPKTFSLSVTRDGKEEVIEVTKEEFPAPLALLIYEPPAHLSGRPYEKGVNVTGVVLVQTAGPSIQSTLEKRGASGLSTSLTWSGNQFERLLAKIAYGFSVSYVGLDKLAEVYVLPAILGMKDDLGRWLGCADTRLKRGKYFHEIELSTVGSEIRVRIRLFGIFPVPEYLVVVGRVFDPQ